MKRLLVVLLALGCATAAAEARPDLENQPISAREGTAAVEPSGAATGPSFTRVGLSLAAVAGLIVVLGWGYKRMAVGPASRPSGPVQLVSSEMLTPKHQVMLLKVGHRILVVGDAGHGMQSLGEITDPAEVVAVLASAGKSESGDDLVSADAFAATLAAASADNFEPLPGADAEPHDDLSDLGAAGEEVRSLIERVRGLQASAGPRTAG